jgi:exopolysaccharide biosynthesis polyprenyl glycosylphosphotransferase
MKLALFETAALFSAVCATLLWTSPVEATYEGLPLLALRALALSLSAVVAFYYADLYDLGRVRTLSEYAERLPGAVGLVLLLLVGVYAVLPEAKMGAVPFLASLAGGLLPLLPVRAAVYRALRSEPFVERVIVLGSCPLAQKLIGAIEARPHLGYSVVGVVDDELPSFNCRHLGRLEDIGRIVEQARADRVFVALASRRGRMPVHQLLECRIRGVRVQDGVEVYEHLTGKIAIESLSPSALIFCRELCVSRAALELRRAVSLVLSAVGLVAVAPLFLVIAVAVKLDSAGPVFFVHQRVGISGRRFRLLKFRTMRPAAGVTSEWVRDNGDRITRVGAWLRKFRLDELPQLVNVLRGDMDLVGPRPHPVSNYELFASQIPYYPLRCAVRPGITGWAQVRYGYANDLEEETEKMRYDLYYVKHLSLWLDIRIVFDTLKTVLLGQGAAGIDPQPARPAMGER